jgi:hypothetical protein
MRRSEPIGHADQQIEDLRPGPRLVVRPLPQRPPIDEFGDQILAPVEFSDVMDGENVRVIQGGDQLRLALEALAVRRIDEDLSRGT